MTSRGWLSLGSMLVMACGGVTMLDDVSPTDGGAAAPDAADAAPDVGTGAAGGATLDDAGDGADRAEALDALPQGEGGDASRADATDGHAEAEVSTSDAGPGPTARVRVANFLSDGRAFAYCIGPRGGPLAGPYGDPALMFGAVSRYHELVAGQAYVVRIAPVTGSCGDSFDPAAIPDFVTGALATGSATTIVATGDALRGAPGVVRALADDVASDVPAGSVQLRMMSFAPDVASVDFGAGGCATYVPLATGIGFARLPGQGSIVGNAPLDARGYVGTRAWGSPVTARAAGVELAASWAIASPSLEPSPLVSVFLIGRAGSTEAPLTVIACFDAAASGAYCSWGQGPARVQERIVNLAPSSPPLDACFKLHAADGYTNRPIVLAAGSPSGVVYPQESAALSILPSTGDYDVKLIAAGSAATCNDAPIASFHIPPLYVGNRIVAVQSGFGATPSYAIVPAFVGWQTYWNQVSLELSYAATSGPQVIANAISELDGSGAGSTFLDAGGQVDLSVSAPGAYRFNVRDPVRGTEWTSRPATFAFDTRSVVYWYASSATERAFVACPTGSASDAGAPGGSCSAL